jgi:transposase
MPWKTMDIREQRVRFVVAASRCEKSMTALCQEFGISRPVGYEWLRRYRQGGVAAIAERSRRPRNSPQQTAEEVQIRVAELRQQYPDWGARKLRVLLREQGIDLGQTTIHRILLRHDLVADQDRRTLGLERFERSEPNELWQMDCKRPKVWHQAVGPLSVLDDHSRYVIVLQAIGSTRGDLVRQQLGGCF